MAAPLHLDFTRGAVGTRLRGAGAEPLLRAMAIKRGEPVHVADATAGLGRDGMLMARAGARVTMIERSREVHDALADALARAHEAGADWAEAVDRITLIHGDSREVLAGLSAAAVLIDPMHPERTKSALVKQEMRDLRALVGVDADAAELFAAARAASPRVVLKWPLRAAFPEGAPKPTYEIPGKAIRYAVFCTPTPTPTSTPSC